MLLLRQSSSCPITPSFYTHPPCFLLSSSRSRLPFPLLGAVCCTLCFQSWLKSTLLAAARAWACITCPLAADDIMAQCDERSGSFRRSPQQTGPLSTFNTAPLLIQPRTCKSRSETLLVWRFSKNSGWQRRSSYCWDSALLPRTSAKYGCAMLQYSHWEIHFD